MNSATICCGILAFILYFIHHLWEKYQFFKKRNVKTKKPLLFFGHTLKSTFGLKHLMEVVADICRAFPDEDVVGYFQFVKPIFIVKNPDLIQNIIIKDFSHFHDRLRLDGEIHSPADADMFMMQGNTWRTIRMKFSPLFSAAKLKYMYSSIGDCGKTLCSVLDKKVGESVEMSDIMGDFTMDVIGSAVFGLEPISLQNPDSMFRVNGRKVLETTWILNLKVLLFVFFPKLANLFSFRGFRDTKLMKYFCDIISHTFEHRKSKNIVRNDFVQMLLHLKENKKIEVQTDDPRENYDMELSDKRKITLEGEVMDNILVGTAFTFLTAGFHSTAMTLSFALYEVALHPEVVEKMRTEIKTCVKGEEPTYDELKSMSYCENVIKETLRLHPAAPSLSRNCTKKYTLANGVTLEESDDVLIPVDYIHKDPAHWEDPLTFNPDRFQNTPRPGTYLPFGDGPRICIGMRFAILEMKFALAVLLRNYDFRLSKKTHVPLKLSKTSFGNTPVGGIYFDIKKIDV